MPAITDEMQVVYGSFTAGASTAYPLDGVYLLSEDFEEGSFECTICAEETSEANFVIACNAIEAAFRQPRRDLEVTLGSTVILSRKHSNTTQTALDTFPTVTKIVDGATGRSRKYTVRVAYGQPADNVSTNGRRSSQMEVVSDAAKRYTATFTGVYTATAGLSASANYLANVDAFCNARLLSILSLTTGTDIELIDERFDPNDTDKTCSFTRVYQEVFFSQAGPTIVAPFDQAKFVDQRFKISIEHEAPGDSPVFSVNQGYSSTSQFRIQRWRRLLATFSCAVDSAQSQQLDTLWRDTVLPWIVKQINTVSDGKPFIMTKKGRDASYDGNTLSGTVEGWVQTDPVHEAEITFEDMIDTGEKLVAAWKKNDKLAYYKYQGPEIRMQTIHERYLSILPTFPSKTAPLGAFGPAAAEGTPVITPIRTKVTPRWVGFMDQPAVLDYELLRETVVQFVNLLPAPKSASSGPAGGGVVNPPFFENLPGGSAFSGGVTF